MRSGPEVLMRQDCQTAVHVEPQAIIADPLHAVLETDGQSEIATFAIAVAPRLPARSSTGSLCRHEVMRNALDLFPGTISRLADLLAPSSVSARS